MVAVFLHLGGGIAHRPPAEAVRGIVYRLAALLVGLFYVMLFGPVTISVDLFGFLLQGTVTADGFLLAIHQLDLEDSFHAHGGPRTVHGEVIGVVKFRAQLRFRTVCGVPIGRSYRTPEALDSEGGVDS